MDTPSLETKCMYVVKRDGVYGKTQYRALTKRYTPWRYAPLQGCPKTGYPTSTRRLDDDEKVTLTTNEGIPENHRYHYPDSMGLIIHKEENYANK